MVSDPAEKEADEASKGDEAKADETDDAIFETLWGRAIEAWDDDKTHAAVLEYALRTQKLPDLAGRYRALKDDDSKGPRATKKLDAIVTAAMHMMMATKTPPRQKPPWNITLTALALFLFVAIMLTYYMFIFRR